MSSKSKNHPPTSPIVLQPHEFAEEAENKLGRANGNTYQRRPGLENVHDGQLMVRLKKHRYIILDYGYVPTEEDKAIAKQIPHIVIPDGAGTTKCATKECNRIGVPLMLYDTDPTEPSSLYLRGGLCFSCQRNLNEKRRTKRKKPPEEQAGRGHSAKEHINPPSRFKVNGDFIDLNPDAIIINGPIEGTRPRNPGYQFSQIANDVLMIVNEVTQEANSLFAHSSSCPPGTPHAIANTGSINAMYEKTFLSLSKATFLITQWKASWDEAIANSVAADAVVSATLDSSVLDEAVAAAESAAVYATESHGGEHAAADEDSIPV